MKKMIDSHCHLDGFLKEGTLTDTLKRAASVGVVHFVAIGTGVDDWKINADLAKQFDQIDYTIGLHPLNVTDGNEELKFEQFFSDSVVPCAIGEIGLDYHSLPGDESREDVINKQKDVFQKQLIFAKNHDLPVAIHSREAFDDTFEILVNSGIKGEKMLFHCFGYSPREMAILSDFGAYVSFSGNVTYKNASPIREALKIANKNRVLIETDCPYLAPMPFRGKPNKPEFIEEVAQFITNFLQDENFCDRAFENTVRFYGLKL